MTVVRRAGLVTLGFVFFAVPHVATAAVVVAEPTGDAAPAFLAELKASLEAVVTEAPAELNAELRSSAAITDAGIDLVVELVPSDGSTPTRETRTASKASALAQTRAMGRSALKGSSPAVTAPTVQAPVETATVPRPAEVTPPPEPLKLPPPPLPEKYDRRGVMCLSFLPTVLFTVVGGGFAFLSATAEPAFGIPGMAIATIGLSLGPSLGYFWIGRTQHALILAGVRLAAVGIGIAFMAMYVHTFVWGDDDIEARSKPGYLAVSILGFTTALVAAIVDAALVGRAADHANAEWRDRKKPTVTVAPVAWSSGRGDDTFGLAVGGTF